MSEATFWESAFLRAGIKGITPGSGGTAQVEAEPAADEAASFRYKTSVVGHAVQAAANENTAHALNERHVIRPTAESLGMTSIAALHAARQAAADAEKARLAGLRNVNLGGIQSSTDNTGGRGDFYGEVRENIRRTGWGNR